ncbi:hypothetical protein [Streptomyces yerevanensis]|uniref:hypothetical protein n=1 Tax=Streptomyces yerevanensis TaxID=66378 RepID=UPI0012FEEA29|nr:hypothetical protein [Streptomyces yerevanensis]
MSKIKVRRSLAVTMAAGLLPLFAACGGTDDGNGAVSGTGSGSGSGSATKDATAPGGQAASQSSGDLAVPADADPETKKQYLVENAIAACMKKKGFDYTPQVDAATDASNGAFSGADYALAKQYRQKYGFGLYAAAVYPDDPKAPNSKASEETPNSRYFAQLTPAQQTAYTKAMGQFVIDGPNSGPTDGCVKDAQDKVYGPGKSAAEQEKEDAAEAERNRQSGQALNGDAELVRLAQAYASCLKKEGITVSTTQPTGIADAVLFSLSSQMPADGTADMDKNTAMPLLTKEISAAMKDLECGKEFRAAYFPKLKAHPYTGGGKG